MEYGWRNNIILSRMRERISSVNSYQPIKLGGKANIDERKGSFIEFFSYNIIGGNLNEKIDN